MIPYTKLLDQRAAALRQHIIDQDWSSLEDEIKEIRRLTVLAARARRLNEHRALHQMLDPINDHLQALFNLPQAENEGPNPVILAGQLMELTAINTATGIYGNASDPSDMIDE